MPQLNIRMSDAQVATVDEAIRRVSGQDDTAGARSDYVREAALVAAAVETHQRPLRAVVQRYLEVCRRSRPALSPAEWRLVCDACNGLWMSDAWSVAGIPLEVADAVRLSGLDRRHEVDGAALVARLRALSYAEFVAVADVVEQFWGPWGSAAVPGEEGWAEERVRL